MCWWMGRGRGCVCLGSVCVGHGMRGPGVCGLGFVKCLLLVWGGGHVVLSVCLICSFGLEAGFGLWPFGVSSEVVQNRIVFCRILYQLSAAVWCVQCVQCLCNVVCVYHLGCWVAVSGCRLV